MECCSSVSEGRACIYALMQIVLYTRRLIECQARLSMVDGYDTSPQAIPSLYFAFLKVGKVLLGRLWKTHVGNKLHRCWSAGGVAPNTTRGKIL